MSRRSERIAAQSRLSLSRNVRMALSYLAFLVFTVFASYPIGRVLASLFRGQRASSTSSASNLRNISFPALLDSAFLQWRAPTVLIALAVAVAGVALTSAVGYGLSRRKTRRRGSTIDRSLIPQILPALMLLAPLVFILFRFGEFNAWLWLSVLYLVTAAPFFGWQLKRAYDALSPSVEEAALIDGCSSWHSFYFIVLPGVAPAFLLTAVFSFIIAWSDCIIAALVLPNGKLFPVSREGELYPMDTVTLWAFYSVTVFMVGFLLGFCLLLFGRLTASDGIPKS